MASTTTTTPVATPNAAHVPPPAPTPPGGPWRHPRLTEITSRKRAATFDDTKFRTALYSTLILILSMLLHKYNPISHIITLSPSLSLVSIWALRLFQLALTLKGFFAIRPLLPWTKPDDLSDIPLTPRQRQLLGLPPTSTPATPGSVYSTPPRYTRSTPRAASASSSIAATVGSSPLAGSRSVSSTPLHGGTPLRNSIFGSPSGGSLSGGSAGGLVRRATVQGGERRKAANRYSLGSPVTMSPLAGMEDSVFASAPSTPTPLGMGGSGGAGQQKGVSVALNNKWLYKRQHGSPSGSTKYI